MDHAKSKRICIVAAIATLAIVVIAWSVSKMTESTAQPLEKREIHLLKLAIQGYLEEYSKLPSLGTTDEAKYTESTGLLIEALTNQNERLNPKRIPFYQPPLRHLLAGTSRTGTVPIPTTSTDVRDPKGNRYRLYLDWDGDGLISNPKEPGKKISNSVIVYSAGRDGDYSTWEDNFTTWDY